jgi:hypothetical protein
MEKVSPEIENYFTPIVQIEWERIKSRYKESPCKVFKLYTYQCILYQQVINLTDQYNSGLVNDLIALNYGLK